MPDPAPNSDYLVGRFFVGLCTLCAIVMLFTICWEIQSGVVHHRTAVTVRGVDNGFWTDIAIQAAIALFFAWWAYRLRRFTRR
jgi:hypothetical protein